MPDGLELYQEVRHDWFHIKASVRPMALCERDAMREEGVSRHSTSSQVSFSDLIEPVMTRLEWLSHDVRYATKIQIVQTGQGQHHPQKHLQFFRPHAVPYSYFEASEESILSNRCKSSIYCDTFCFIFASVQMVAIRSPRATISKASPSIRIQVQLKRKTADDPEQVVRPSKFNGLESQLRLKPLSTRSTLERASRRIRQTACKGLEGVAHIALVQSDHTMKISRNPCPGFSVFPLQFQVYDRSH